ncbi:MAG: hypothetical protein P4L53_13625 [Candidatus Obscuribacterales bacterium]|nr:hypothetical protein [Candidatus Obscuribacterales bacterium]
MPLEPESLKKTPPVSDSLAPQTEKSVSVDKLMNHGSASYAVSILAAAETVINEQNAVQPPPICIQQGPNQFPSAGYCEQVKTVLNTGIVPSYFRLLIFNVVYFMVAFEATLDYARRLIHDYLGTPVSIAYVLATVLIPLIWLDGFKSVRTFINSTNGTLLPLSVQKSLRAMALGVPFIVMLGAGTDYYATSSTEYPIANADYIVGLKIPIPNAQEYSKKLELGSTLAFYNPSTLKLLQHRADQAGLYLLALKMADQRLFLTPNDDYAKVEKGLTLISSLALADQGRLWFEQELKKTPEDGDLWSLKSLLESQTGQTEAALLAANEHVKFHKDEAYAYDLRADIYDRLGMNEAAKADRVKASDLKKSITNK